MRAGWPLHQSHAETKCSDCHTSEFKVSAAARLTVRRAGIGWTGLDRECVSCHEDVHRGALGQACEKCHDEGKWKVTPGFSHDSTAYPLTAKHTEVTCAKCHLDPRLGLKLDPARNPVPRYRPLPHAQCSACHADPHAGRLGVSCSDCHTTRGFKVIDRQSFDHDRTNYPLRGRHIAVACAKCHDFNTTAGRKPPFATCTACHQDVHGGTATLAGQSIDCAACHDVTGFNSSTFTAAQHRSTKYPLEGKHQAVECASCHRKDLTAPVARFGSARVLLRPAFSRCRDCHADDHGGQLAKRPDQGECAACHTVSGWKPSRFDAQAHASLRVTLDGKHGEIACAACHGARRSGLRQPATTAALGKAAVLLRPSETGCTDCHLDPASADDSPRGATRAKPQGVPHATTRRRSARPP